MLLLKALQETLPRLAEIHLHDGYCRELPGGAMSIADHLPLESFLDQVAKSGFSGPILFELTVEEAQASLDAIRELRPELVP